uniref:Uncharacterized protein n=1 Tax=Rousettus aegyptiacus TaxID=9407 RepID=A0A7J8CI61_ROUAE|nr:hypothetical protein HJG63_009071 [Rousettus aegyptiacus]
MGLGEVQVLTEELTEDDLMEMSAEEPGPDDEEDEVVPENELTLDNLAGEFQLLKTAFDFFYDMDLSTIWVLELKQMAGLVPYRNIFREMKRKLDRNLLYFRKVNRVCLPLLPLLPSEKAMSF